MSCFGEEGSLDPDPKLTTPFCHRLPCPGAKLAPNVGLPCAGSRQRELQQATEHPGRPQATLAAAFFDHTRRQPSELELAEPGGISGAAAGNRNRLGGARAAAAEIPRSRPDGQGRSEGSGGVLAGCVRVLIPELPRARRHHLLLFRPVSGVSHLCKSQLVPHARSRRRQYFLVSRGISCSG